MQRRYVEENTNKWQNNEDLNTYICTAKTGSRLES